MQNTTIRTPAVLAGCALLLALAACGQRVQNNDAAQMPQANVEINRQGEKGSKESSEAIGVANRHAEKEARVNLGGVGDMSVMDPDVLLSEQVKAAPVNNPVFAEAKVDVRSRDGNVVLRGHAPDPTVKERATEVARSVANVRSVDNRITLG